MLNIKVRRAIFLIILLYSVIVVFPLIFSHSNQNCLTNVRGSDSSVINKILNLPFFQIHQIIEKHSQFS